MGNSTHHSISVRTNQHLNDQVFLMNKELYLVYHSKIERFLIYIYSGQLFLRARRCVFTYLHVSMHGRQVYYTRVNTLVLQPPRLI